MNFRKHFEILSRYNRWMNENLYRVCAEIPDEERKADRGAFFRSIHGTLNHLLLADRRWLGWFLDQPFLIRALDQELYGDFAELRSERRKTDAEIEAWVGSLTEDRLAQSLTITTLAGAELTYPLWFALDHLFNHQTHHRGQITTLIFQLGYDTDPTDLHRLPGLAF